MSFARPRNTPTGAVSSALQRQMDRQIEERCAEHAEQQLATIKKAAAPKQRVDQRDWDKHEAAIRANAKLHAAKMRKNEESLRQQAKDVESRLQGMEARTNLALRNSVTERGNTLQEAGFQKRHAEAARHAKNKRKLAKLVQKAQPRTEVALSSDVLQGLDALEQEKRSLHRAEQSDLKAANKQAILRLRDVVRAKVFDGGAGDALEAHAAAHEQRLGEMERLKAAKRVEEGKAAKAHKKRLEELKAAKPRTVVTLSAEHGEMLESLTQASELRARANREALREHEQKLTALTAGSQRKIALPHDDDSASARAAAATAIQAARRGSLGRNDAEVVRRALARRQAVRPTSGAGSESKLVQKLQKTVALAQNQSRHTQRRHAVTPDEQSIVEAAAATVAAAAAAA